MQLNLSSYAHASWPVTLPLARQVAKVITIFCLETLQAVWLCLCEVPFDTVSIGSACSVAMDGYYERLITLLHGQVLACWQGLCYFRLSLMGWPWLKLLLKSYI